MLHNFTGQNTNRQGIFKGGEQGRKAFERIFKFGDDNRFEIVNLIWNSEKMEIRVTENRLDETVLIIRPYSDDKDVFLHTNSLCISYFGDSMPESLENTLRNKSLPELEDYSFNKITDLFFLQTDITRLEETVSYKNAEGEKLFKSKALLSSWGSSSSWYNFFGSAEISRCQLDSLDFFNYCTFIQHCDMECITVIPQLDLPIIEMVYYPWKDDIRALDYSAKMLLEMLKYIKNKSQENSEFDFLKKILDSDVFEPENDSFGMYLTDLTERDVIMGTSIDKLTEVLDDVTGKELGDLLFCSATCVPIVSGEDTESIVKRYQKTSKTPLLFLTCTAGSMENVFYDLLVTRRKEVQNRISGKKKNHINLIGFSNDHALTELIIILSGYGVKINTVILPHLNTEAVDKFPHAELNVVYSNNLWSHLYSQLSLDSDVRTISPSNPYGISRTEKFIADILDELKIDSGFSPDIPEEWNTLQKEAREYTVCFVIDGREPFRLTEDGHTWGVPLIPMAEEMGFNIAVFIYAEDRLTAYKAAKSVNGLFREPDRHTIKAFRDECRLKTLLSDEKINAVYSDYFFDHRITTAGKAQFSLQIFELGINGALRTLKRLLRLCRLKFYTRYSKYIEKAYE